MALLIDTNILIKAERGKLTSAAYEAYGEAYISAITVSELMIGVHLSAPGTRAVARREKIEQLLTVMTVLPFDESVALRHAELLVRLKKDGQMIGANDLIIAATALAHKLPLLTANIREFKQVRGLEVVGLS